MNSEIDIFALRRSFIMSTIMMVGFLKNRKVRIRECCYSLKQTIDIIICISVFLSYNMLTNGVIKLDTLLKS